MAGQSSAPPIVVILASDLSDVQAALAASGLSLGRSAQALLLGDRMATGNLRRWEMNSKAPQ